jgi:hypothetical protein
MHSKVLYCIEDLLKYSSEYPVLREVVPYDAIPKINNILCSGNDQLIYQSVLLLRQLCSFSETYKRFICSSDLISLLITTYSRHYPSKLLKIFEGFPDLYPAFRLSDLEEVFPIILRQLRGARVCLFGSLLRTSELFPQMSKALIEADVISTLFAMAREDEKLLQSSNLKDLILHCLYEIFVENSFDIPINNQIISGMMWIWNHFGTFFDDWQKDKLVSCLTTILSRCPSDEVIVESGVASMLLNQTMTGNQLCISARVCVLELIRSSLNKDQHFPRYFVESDLFSFFLFVLKEKSPKFWKTTTKSQLDQLEAHSCGFACLSVVPVGEVIDLTQRMMRSDPKYVKEIREMSLTKELKTMLLTGFPAPEPKKVTPKIPKPSSQKRPRLEATEEMLPTRKSPRSKKPRHEENYL